VYEANTFGRNHDRIVSADPLRAGPAEITFEYAPEKPAADNGTLFSSSVGSGTGTLTVNGRQQGSLHFPIYGGFRSAILESFDLGKDTGSPVSTDYDGPFNFTGKIDTVKIELVK
jgi:arylsulfatase